MKLIVTGAAGFIGAHLVRRLSALDGVELITVARKDGLRIDMAERGWTAKLPSSADIVINLAQSRRYREFPDGASDMLHVNVDAAAELAEWAARSGVRRFIQASTGNVYKASTGMLDELAPCDPDSMYGVSKFAAEGIVGAYSGIFHVVVLRLFGIYGEGQIQGIVPTIFEKLQNDQEIPLAGGIGLAATPMHVSDCVRSIEKISMMQGLGSTGKLVLNIGGLDRYDLGDVATIAGRIIGRTPRLKVVDGVPRTLLADVRAATRILGFEPRMSLDEGLRRVVDGMDVGRSPE